MSEGYDRLRRAVEGCNDAAKLRRFAASLSPEELALLEEVVGDMAGELEEASAGAVHWRADPARMACHFEPTKFQPHPYFLYLGRKFTQLVDGSDPFQVWEVPAQHGKSTVASQYGPAWVLDRDSTQRLLNVTYGQDLAERNGLAVRDLLVEHGDVLRASLRRDQHRRDRFLTDQGGGLLSAGMFSIGGGWSATGIVIDDPYKGWEQAHSGAQRRRIANIFRTIIWMRRTTDDAWVLLCTTRYHEQDMAAELAAFEGEHGVRFTVTRMAQYAEAPDLDSPDPTLRLPDPLGREVGQSLGRWGQQALDVRRQFLGEYLFAGLEQQRPAPPEGTEILREWFNFSDTLPAQADYAIASWDTKLKDNEQGDYVCGQLWWRVGGSYWLLDVLRGKWNEATTRLAIALMAHRHPEIRVQVIEYAANAPEVMAGLQLADASYVVDDRAAALLGMTEAERGAVQELVRRGMSSLVGKPPKGSKEVRMRAVTPIIEGHNVFVPEGASWLPAYLDEMAAFPHGAHDDQVDPTSLALAYLSAASKVKVTNPAKRSWGSQSPAAGIAYR